MIFIEKLSKEIGARTLFSIDRLTVSEEEKIGLIGDNGAGKTTFLRILSGLDTDYRGRVEVSGAISSFIDLSDEEGGADDLQSLAEHHSPGEAQNLKIKRLLAERSAFLLMDEPGSHLDIRAKTRLAESLKNRYTGFILVSHDRDFIDRACTKIIELTDGGMEIFNGDYSFYLEERTKRRKFAQREYESYIAEKKRLTAVARDVKVQSQKVKRTPSRMGNSEARLHKMGGQTNKKNLDKQAKAVASRIERLEVKAKPKEETPIELTVSERDKIFSEILIRSEDLNKRFGGKVIFDHAETEIPNRRKTALLGDNGSGKTTLIQMILAGELQTHPRLKIGYYSQLGEILDPEKSILDNILATSIYDGTLSRITLARLGFRGDDVFKRTSLLSAGEKAKVKLAKLITSDFNFLILDEPTNYLDIRALEALEELLKGYDRPLLFVTHDVAFIRNIADHFLLIEDHRISAFSEPPERYFTAPR